MSDADRLREAADLIDRWLDRLEASPSYPDLVVALTSIPGERRATAALLRAGAVMQDEYTDAEANARMFKALPIYHALHDLADIILGDSE